MSKWATTICRKWNGDDDYSWAIFDKRTGMRMVEGLHKSEKNYYREKCETKIKAEGNKK